MQGNCVVLLLAISLPRGFGSQVNSTEVHGVMNQTATNSVQSVQETNDGSATQPRPTDDVSLDVSKKTDNGMAAKDRPPPENMTLDERPPRLVDSYPKGLPSTTPRPQNGAVSTTETEEESAVSSTQTEEELLRFGSTNRLYTEDSRQEDKQKTTQVDLKMCSSGVPGDEGGGGKKVSGSARPAMLRFEVTDNEVWEGDADFQREYQNMSSRVHCLFSFTVPQRQYLSVVIEKFFFQPDTEPFFDVQVVAGNNREAWSYFEENIFEEPFVISSSSNSMLVSVRAKSILHLYMRFRFLLTELSGLTYLPVTQKSPVSGFVTSFGFDWRSRYGNNIAEAHADIEVPAGHNIMISFPHFDLQASKLCRADNLALNVEGYMRHAWIKCGDDNMAVQLYDNALTLTLYTDAAETATGFKMIYSIHPVSETPRPLQDGLYNCSVPHYSSFREHFDCNLERECDRGEDEENCPYTTDECGPGMIDAGNKCFRYISVKGRITWFDAYERCRAEGAHSQKAEGAQSQALHRAEGLRLVSPRTPAEWDVFKEVLAYGKRTYAVYVGLTTSSSDMAAVYGDVWQWSDQTMAFYANVRGQQISKPACAYVPPIQRDILYATECGAQKDVHFILCEREKNSNRSAESVQIPVLGTTLATSNATNFPLIQCPDGHMTWDFLSCDPHTHCGLDGHVASCRIPSSVEIPMFVCDDGIQTLHYTQICDHRQDCFDGSDETFCFHSACPERTCRNQQCVTEDQWCDGMHHCTDRYDEGCPQFIATATPSIPPPAVVYLDGHGRYTFDTLSENSSCPQTHFQCPGDSRSMSESHLSTHSYCLPIYLRCNGVFDCPGHEDEADCSGYACSGLYRCRGSQICLHPHHLCDGVFHCPLQDDELLCEEQCPSQCSCQGLAFVCPRPFPAISFPKIRYLDASGSGMATEDLSNNRYLVRLELRSCGLKEIADLNFQNLRYLDLGSNALQSVTVQSFVSLKNLRTLRLGGNPIILLERGDVDGVFRNVHTLDLSHTLLTEYNGKVLAGFKNLKNLNLSHTPLRVIGNAGFLSTPNLEVLDLQGSPVVTFPRDTLRPLTSLETVHADSFKFCCPAMMPATFNAKNCHAPVDVIASCDDLLRSNAYRGFLWFVSLMAVAGNLGGLVIRLYRGEAARTSFHVFVSNLGIADLLMGVYLAIIGSADQVYRGEYLWKDSQWKASVACKAAGFLALLSSEVSAFFVCLITLDRFLCLKFPFTRCHFSVKTALLTSTLAWLIGAALAAVPLLPMTSSWEFYGQTGICLPLPITNREFQGQDFAFGVMVVFNFVLFLMIAIGQVVIFLAVRSNTISSDSSFQNSSREATLARRLTTVVLTDFLCWFPIGLLGLLASRGTTIPGEVNVAMAIFVLPFNSALNPFLYTFNVVMERRRQRAEARLMEQLRRRLAVSKNGKVGNGARTGHLRTLTIVEP